jgi:tetratricopeptide (TPR) repeat protein
LRCIGLRNIGSAYFYQGKLQQAIEYATRALAVSQQLHEHFETATLFMNLAIPKYVAGDWPGALADFEQSRTRAVTLGSTQLVATVSLNLGAAYINVGNEQSAFHHLYQGLDLARKNHLHLLEVLTLFRLADLQIRLQKWAEATIWLQQAEQRALVVNYTGALIAIYRGWAEVKLATGEMEMALAYAEQSLALAREQEERLEEGESLRVLGQTLLAHDQLVKAFAAFQTSLDLFTEHDPYEAARTMVCWGQFLLAGTSQERGLTLLRNARTTFLWLGAQRDLAQAEELLWRTKHDEPMSV